MQVLAREGAMLISIDEVQARLREEGYFVTRMPAGAEDPIKVVLDVARSLGELFVPLDCDPDAPVIRTEPARRRRAAPFDRPEQIGWHGDFSTYEDRPELSLVYITRPDPDTPVIRTAPARRRRAAPFDRPEQIGWHGDFSTYEDRPELSLVYITRPDPRGGDYGAWRLASVARAIAALRATDEGRAAFELLSGDPLPFSYTGEGESSWFRIIEPGSDGSFGLRFYLPSIRRGCIGQYGEVPAHIEAALTALERAADEVGEIVPTHEGSLLIASNWLALHDRVRQTISRSQPNREALLCFVGHPYVGAFRYADT